MEKLSSELILQIVYSISWLCAAGFTFYYGFKVNKMLFICSALFIFMSAWQFTDIFVSANLFEGIYAIIYRIIVAIFLIIGCFAYYKYKSDSK